MHNKKLILINIIMLILFSFSTLAFPPAGYASNATYNISTGLIMYFNGSSNTDLSPYANNVVRGNTSYGVGVRGDASGAWKFSNSPGYRKGITNSTSMQTNNTGTICSWMKLNNSGLSEWHISRAGTSGANPYAGHGFYTTAGRLIGFLNGYQTAAQFFTSAAQFGAFQRWSLNCIGWNKTTLWTYANSSVDATARTAGKMFPGYMWIGGWGSGYTGADTIGNFDEFMYWNYFLGTSRVNEIKACRGGCWVTTIAPTIVLSTPKPVNNTDFNTQPLNFNLTANITRDALCRFSTNDTLQKSLVGEYLFTLGTITQATDTSGMKRNATCGGVTSCPTNVSGKYGRARQFDGVNDQLNLSTITLKNKANGSIALWYYPTFAGTSGNGDLVRFNDTNGKEYIELAFFSGSLAFFMDKDQTGFSGEFYRLYHKSTYPNLNQTWYHIVVTWNISNTTTVNDIRVYRNGVHLTPTAAFNSTAVHFNVTHENWHNAYLGGSFQLAPTGFFDGLIDDVKIWNRTLTSQEAIDQYNESLRTSKNLQTFRVQKNYTNPGHNSSKNLSYAFDQNFSSFANFANHDENYFNITKTLEGTKNGYTMILKYSTPVGAELHLGCVNSSASYITKDIININSIPTANYSFNISDAHCLNVSTHYIVLYISNPTGTNGAKLYEIYKNVTVSKTIVSANFQKTHMADGNYKYNVTCWDNQSSPFSAGTSSYFFRLDTSSPVILNTAFRNNSGIIKSKKLRGTFNFTDNILLHTANFSIDGTAFYNKASINKKTWGYNFSVNVSAYALGKHTLTVRVADGHTLDKLLDADAYNPTNGLLDNYVKYDIKKPYDAVKIEVYAEQKSLLDKWSVVEKVDRYSEVFKPSTPSDTQTFTVKSDQEIYIAEDAECHYGCQWLIIGDHWKDFVLQGEPDARVEKIRRISPYEVSVTVSGIKNNPRTLTFDSLGDLNIVSYNYTFYLVNMTETYSTNIISGYNTTFNLSVKFGNITTFNTSLITPHAWLRWNTTNLTATLVHYNSAGANFTYHMINIPEVTITENISHRWFFMMTNITPPTLNTTNRTQIVYNLTIGVCSPTINYSILNMIYYDELTNDNINLTNTYNLTFDDGIDIHYFNGYFNWSSRNSICTNLNPANTTYNFDMSGTFILTSPGYITRVFNINPLVPVLTSNNPPTNLPLFLIPTANSSSVTYNWFTTNFQLIDGTMRIYECELNGTKNLVESTPITNGVATANIQLLLKSYYYDVIIDGLVYTNPSGFSACHVESTTTITYYVDINQQATLDKIGLQSVNCYLTKLSNTSLGVIWESNPENSDYVQACVKAQTSTITGLSSIFYNCSNASQGYAVNVTLPVPAGGAVATVTLIQGANQKVCGNMDFHAKTTMQKQLGTTGLFMTIILFIALTLLFVTYGGEVMLVGGALALGLTYFLGTFISSWLGVASAIVFIIIGLIIGQNSKNK